MCRQPDQYNLEAVGCRDPFMDMLKEIEDHKL